MIRSRTIKAMHLLLEMDGGTVESETTASKHSTSHSGSGLGMAAVERTEDGDV
jgi:hypothetical protein